MRVKGALLVAAALVLAAPSLMAQTEEKPADAAKKIMKAVTQGSIMEVELGKVALEKGRTEEVRNFGSMMVKDHSEAIEKTRLVAQKKEIELPREMKQEQKDTVARISKLSGQEFDQAYMREMVIDHVKDVNEVRAAIPNLTEPDVKQWAEETLAVLDQHRETAKDVAQQVGVDVAAAETEAQQKIREKQQKE